MMRRNRSHHALRRRWWTARGITLIVGLALGTVLVVSFFFDEMGVPRYLGMLRHAQQLEEFSHMELFSLRDSDSVVIFSAFDPAGIGGKLLDVLRSKRYAASLLAPYGSNTVETIFHFIFATQLRTLAVARARGLSMPYFVGAKRKLQVSDSMIYHE